MSGIKPKPMSPLGPLLSALALALVAGCNGPVGATWDHPNSEIGEDSGRFADVVAPRRGTPDTADVAPGLDLPRPGVDSGPPAETTEQADITPLFDISTEDVVAPPGDVKEEITLPDLENDADLVEITDVPLETAAETTDLADVLDDAGAQEDLPAGDLAPEALPEDLWTPLDAEETQDLADEPFEVWACPHADGQCEGLVWKWCNPANETLHETSCDDGSVCTVDGCDPAVGCVHLPVPCDDDVACTVDSCHPVDGCLHLPAAGLCDDDNECTQDTCEPALGCAHTPLVAPCDDLDPCTEEDLCTEGVCLGVPVACGNGFGCDEGACVCLDVCPGMECGNDLCGNACGSCPAGSQCTAGECVESAYPPPPYGPFVGDTLPSQVYLAPADLSERTFHPFYGDGKVLLVTFNAGWCKVCKEDTVVLNAWTAAWHEAGLRILSILYETTNGAPINQGFALWWEDYYALQFPLWMDTPEADAQGKATGGNLATFRQPNGPVEPGYFPVTLIVCPATMKILYISKGFYDDIVQAEVEKYLFTEDCSNAF